MFQFDHSPSLHASRNLKILLTVFAGLLVITLGTAVYKEAHQVDSPDVTSNEGSDGKPKSTERVTYTDPDNGYSFSYPATWATGSKVEDHNRVDFGDGCNEVDKNCYTLNLSAGFYVLDSGNPVKYWPSTLSDFIHSSELGKNFDLNAVTSMKLDSLDAYRLYGSVKINNTTTNTAAVLYQRDGAIFSLELKETPNSQTKSSSAFHNSSLMDEIVTSFKTTGPTSVALKPNYSISTTNWKAETNTNRKFSFKHPTDYNFTVGRNDSDLYIATIIRPQSEIEKIAQEQPDQLGLVITVYNWDPKAISNYDQLYAYYQGSGFTKITLNEANSLVNRSDGNIGVDGNHGTTYMVAGKDFWYTLVLLPIKATNDFQGNLNATYQTIVDSFQVS